jgi:hypothetical protein
MLLLLSFSAALVVAQGDGFASLTWWTVDGGGGESGGGAFRLKGSAGQPDAGGASGGDFRLGGGYWEGGAATSAAAPQSLYLPLVVR